MTGCCSSGGSREKATDSFFSRHAKRYARKYKRKGPDKVQRQILSGLDRAFYEDRSILDVGCGTGNIHFELLRRGAARATGVDIAEGMIGQARSLSKQHGFEEKTRYVQGDFVEKSDEIETADITIMDKVVCCYDDLNGLMRNALAKTAACMVISHPRNVWYVRWGFNVQQVATSILRMKFRPVWHEWKTIHNMLGSNGYSKVFEDDTFLWHVVIFRK